VFQETDHAFSMNDKHPGLEIKDVLPRLADEADALFGGVFAHVLGVTSLGVA